MATLLIMSITVLAAVAIAAAPLLCLRRMQFALQGTLGSLCLALGCGAFFAMTTSALAADSGAKEATKPVPPAPPSASPSLATADESSFFAKLPEGAELHTPPSVPGSEVIVPPGQPEWVGRNITVGSEHSIAVCSGPFATEAEANHELDRLLKQKSDEYIAEQLGNSLAPQLVGYDIAKIKRELVKPQNVYHEQIQVSIGPMQRVHALLEFSPDFRSNIQRQWTSWTAYYRLLQTGLVAGGVLLFLGTVFSYFRLDTATRGYYTGRLQFMTAAAILGIVGAGAVLARWIYWL